MVARRAEAYRVQSTSLPTSVKEVMARFGLYLADDDPVVVLLDE